MTSERTKAMDNLIAQDADLIDKLRDEDSYYRLQEKHWCIDAEELERQRLAAADRIEELASMEECLTAELGDANDRIEALEAENERLREALEQIASGAWVICRDDPLDVRTIARAALGEKQ